MDLPDKYKADPFWNTLFFTFLLGYSIFDNIFYLSIRDSGDLMVELSLQNL